jgi:hypothetical protein
MTKVIDINIKRKEKEINRGIGRNSDPLRMTHLRGSPHLNREVDTTFAERMARIKTSLEKIDYLMKALKEKEETK